MKLVLALLLCSPFVRVFADEFERALALPKRTANTVFRDSVKPQWLPDKESFWYQVQTGPEAKEFVLINARTGERRTATNLPALGLPDTEAARTSLMKIDIHPSRRSDTASAVKFVNQLATDIELFWINPEGEHVRYGMVHPGAEREMTTYAGHVWLLASPTGESLATFEAEAQPRTLIIDGKGISAAKPPKQTTKTPGTVSPDKKWSAYIDRGLVMLREASTGTVSSLSADMDDKSTFRGDVAWAPDSHAFVVSSAAPVTTRRITLIESSPKEGVQPARREVDYVKPGDPLPQPVPVIFQLKHSGSERIRVKNDLFPTPFNTSGQLNVRWALDSREFFLDYNQRGHQLYRIVGVNAVTGQTRTVVEETSKTFIDYTKKTWRHWLDNTGELLWMSERSGWCQLYLVDLKTGQTRNALTTGSWPVREVLHVDEVAREVWFLASGLRPAEDPYDTHLCRVKFDGSGFQQLTEGGGQHRIEFSPERKCFVDTWSRSDQPPTIELRRSGDGSLVCVLEKADASALLATGWALPERFVAKGRDGATDIHGVIIKPTDFDPAKKYPVVEEVYAGPHSAFAPKEFGRLMRQHQIAELGFIVVQADGMGTNYRGKAFHDVCWKNLKDAGFPDRIAWIKAAAQTRPWMDLSRVGIYGGSAGGQNAMRALLDYHDFYQVAVADCGCHDNRMDKIWWNEQWLGWPVDESYARSSNVDDAPKLAGHLLLLVGELDTNVDPATTMQVVAALQKAGKPFEFMPIAGTGHGSAETPYGSRLRMEFLAKHLLHPTPR